MSIHINQKKCVGCHQCVNVCPGNLLVMNEKGKAEIRFPKDCWGCASCLKECKEEAISLYLGADVGGTGGLLSVRMTETEAKWTLTHSEGEQITININRKNSNRY